MKLSPSTRWANVSGRVLPVIRFETEVSGCLIAVHFASGGLHPIAEVGRFLNEKPFRYGKREHDKALEAILSLRNSHALELQEWLQALQGLSNGRDSSCYKIILRSEDLFKSLEVSA